MKPLKLKARPLRQGQPRRPATAKLDRVSADSIAAALAVLGRSVGVGGRDAPGGLELVAAGLRDVAAAIRELASAVESRP